MVLDYWDSETPKVLTIGYVYYKVCQNSLYPESILHNFSTSQMPPVHRKCVLTHPFSPSFINPHPAQLNGSLPEKDFALQYEWRLADATDRKGGFNSKRNVLALKRLCSLAEQEFIRMSKMVC